MKKKKAHLVKTVVGLFVVGIAAGMSSCGRESSARRPQPSESPAPGTLAPGPTESAPTNPTGTANPSSQSLAPASRSKVTAAGDMLLGQIQRGDHAQATDTDRAQLLTQEAQRCRGQDAVLVPQESGFSEAVPSELLATYGRRHTWVNPLDPCRQQLGFWLSSGPRMKLENLIQLETCTRQRQIDKIPSTPDRNAAIEGLLVEQLSLLCRLEPERLSAEVQEALSSGFLETWSKWSASSM